MEDKKIHHTRPIANHLTSSARTMVSMESEELSSKAEPDPRCNHFFPMLRIENLVKTLRNNSLPAQATHWYARSAVLFPQKTWLF